MITAAELSALLQVVVVDLVLAGDNAIVVGMVAAGLPAKDRARVIVIGIAAATLMRVAFAAVTVQCSRSWGCCSPAACSCCGWRGSCGARSGAAWRTAPPAGRCRRRNGRRSRGTRGAQEHA